MFSLLKSLFGIGPKVDYKDLINNGASVIDVRTPGEFASGHFKGSVNIPLDQVSSKTAKIKDLKEPIIVVCASGMRSAMAKSIIKKQGIDQVYNAGRWQSLR